MQYSDAGMLELWERGADRHVLDRGLLLLSCARSGEPLQALADVSISARDQALIAWRSLHFGKTLPATIDCPECGTRLEFILDSNTLCGDCKDTPIEIDGLRVRRPTSRDLAVALKISDPEQAAYLLAKNCCENLSGELNPTQLAQIESTLALADAAADIELDFSCEHCDHVWQNSFDIVSYLWKEIETYASRLLAEIHTLACAYGWSEREILALSPVRRAAYLNRVYA